MPQGMACGFELDDTAEYTGSSGTITIENTVKYLSPLYAKVTASGYIYWTLSQNSDWVCIVSVHVRLPLSSHVKPIKLTRGGYEWSVAFDDTANEVRTVTLKHSTGQLTYSVAIPAEKWVNVVMYVGFRNLGLYIDGNMLCDDHDTFYTGSTGTVTDLRCEAYTGSGSSLLYIDDVSEWMGSWAGEIAVVMPYIPEIDQLNALSIYPTTANSAWEVIDERAANDDTDYLYISGATNAKSYFGAKVAPISGWTMKSVMIMPILHRAKKTAAGTGSETAIVYLKVGDGGTEYTASTLSVTTGYTNKLSYVYTCNDGGFKPTSRFQDYNNDDAIQIGVKLTSTAGVDVRCTKLRACVMALYIANPYTGGASQDIVGNGAWELSYEVDTTAWADGNHLTAYINAVAVPLSNSYVDPSYDKLGVRLQYRSTYTAVLLTVGAYKSGSSVHAFETVSMGARRKFKIRIVGHDNFISVFESGVWIYTYTMTSVTYPSTLNLYLISDASITVTNVYASELADWREATYIDMQSTIASGISSVIQERPVEVTPLQGGIVDFSYNRTRSAITPANIYMHKITSQNNQNAGSHYVVYYSDVAMIVDENFMDSDGYVTRVLQMSQLGNGAVDAATIVAKRARENQEVHELQLAPDIRIEPGDKVTASYTLSGTGTVVSEDFIAENVGIEIQEGAVRMAVGGRQYV